MKVIASLGGRAATLALLRADSLFSPLAEPALQRLADSLTPQVFAPGQTIVRTGDLGDCWYLIANGTAAVVHPDLVGRDVTLASLGPGQGFGERALLTRQPRTATVRAVTPLVAHVLDRPTFARLTAADPQFADRLRRHVDVLEVDAFVKRASPFARLPAVTLWALIARLAPLRLHAGETIVREGEPADALYLVRSGRAQVHRGQRVVAVLEAGDVFGEVALLTGLRRTASVRALDDVELLRLAAEDFAAVVGEQPSLAGFFAELLHIRFRDPSRTPRPPAAGPGAPFAARRQRLPYWLIVATGALVFALLTAFAALRPDQPALFYAALAFGSLLGPALCLLYLTRAHILSQRTRALALTAALAAAIGLPAAAALQHAAGIVASGPLAAVLIAAIEEPAKVFGVLWLIRRSSLRFQMDGVIYGAAAGVGFAVCETLLYGVARVDTVGALLAALWLRTLLAPFTHGTWTALLCAVVWRQRGAAPLRAAAKVALALGAVVLLHALWNWQPVLFPLSFAWLLLVGAASVGLLRYVLGQAMREEVAAVLALNPELRQAAAPGPIPSCRACGQAAPGGAHYCPRCSLALRAGPRAPALPAYDQPRPSPWPSAPALLKGVRS